MANPLFYAFNCAARFDITPGAASRAAYFLIQQQYQFGFPVVIGRSPQEFAATYGIPYSEAVSVPFAVPLVSVETFPNATPVVVIHNHDGSITTRTVSSAVPGGTLVGVNYVDDNLVLHPDVDWTWQISVELYFNSAGAAPPIGKWEQQLITYTGDGTSNRLIPTNFPLDSGVVAVWVNPQITRTPSFRHSGMTGTTMSISPLSTTQGIMALQAGGFTVKDGVTVKVNTAGEQYTAIVFRDSTSDNRFMRVGDYAGLSDVSTNGTFTVNSNLVTCASFGVGDIGRPITSSGNGPASAVITGIPDASHFTMDQLGVGSGLSPIDAPVAARTIIHGRTIKPTQVWVLGRVSVLAYCTDDFSAPNSLSYELEAKTLTGQITALNPTNFGVGTDNNVNDGSLHYYWAAFTIPIGSAIRNLFSTYKVAGTGGVVTVALPFTPAFGTGRQFTAGVPGSVWRGPFHTGTQSRSWDDAVNAANGIRAMGAASMDLGTDLSHVSQDIYGFALVAGAQAVTVPAPPVYTLVATPVPPDGGPGVGSVTAGCSSTVAPGAGGSGTGCSAMIAAGTGGSGSGCSATVAPPAV